MAQGYLADATNTGSTTLVSAVAIALAAAVNNKPEVQIRIITTELARFGGASSADEWIGIDDIAMGAPGFRVRAAREVDAVFGTIADTEPYNWTNIFISPVYDPTRLREIPLPCP